MEPSDVKEDLRECSNQTFEAFVEGAELKGLTKTTIARLRELKFILWDEADAILNSKRPSRYQMP